jgi:ketosteroid isomerase-like protein
MKCGNLLVPLVGLILAPGAAAGQTTGDLASEVRSTELAFARTMADRDVEAFRSYVADEAVFFGGSGPLRGADAVTAAWGRFFEGDEAPFSWEPESVEVLDSGTLALSSGPVRDPEGNVIGTFNSIWRRATDGSWKVVFDKGCPACDCEP